jgi:hypothetical protein
MAGRVKVKMPDKLNGSIMYVFVYVRKKAEAG